MQSLTQQQQQIILNMQRDIDYHLRLAQETKEKLNLVFTTLGIQSVMLNLVPEEVPEEKKKE